MSSQYGTVDTAPEDYKEGIGSGATLYPQSLYLDQLQKRLARESGSNPGGNTQLENPAYTTINLPGTFNATDFYSASSEVTKMNENSVGYIGNLVENSTITYKINVAKAGYYTMNVKAVSGNSNAVRRLTFTEGSNTLGTIDVTNTSSWTDFKNHKITVYFATAGEKTLTIKSSGAANISDISFLRAEDSSVEVPTSSTAEKKVKVVGYLPSYRTSSIDSIDYSALTHLCLAFMTYKNGNLSSGFSDSDTKRIISKCRANDVKILIALGGGGGFDTSGQPFSTAAKRTEIIDKLIAYVDQYNLDGVDIDIEVTDGNIWSNYEAFVSELSTKLKARNKLLTMAVSSWFTGPITNKTYTYFDFINLMTYDNAFGDGDVAPWSQIYNQTSHYNGKGVSNDRMTIGVPFYGYGSGSTSYTYKEILAMNSANSTRDYYNGIYYNGATTIAEKAKYSKNYAGIMIWELGQDASGSNSLLGVIKKELQNENAGTVVAPTVTNIPGTVKVDSFASKSDNVTINTGDVTYAGNLNNGLGLDYYINVSSAGDYTVNLRLAAGDAQYNAKSMLVKINGNEVARTDVVGSSSWTTFIDHSVNVTFKEAGNYKISVEAVEGACNVADFTIAKKADESETQKPTETQSQTQKPTETQSQTQKPTETQASTETNSKQESMEAPAEVFGVVVESTQDNEFAVVWGRNIEKEEKGQLYNIYIDGMKAVSSIPCGRYLFAQLDPGEYIVKVTAFIGDIETEGVTLVVNVTGEAITETESQTEKAPKIEINGAQISTVNEGFRMVYSVGDNVDKIKNVGLIYGLADKNTEEDMYVNSEHPYVYTFEATEKGRITSNVSNLDNAQTYAMTMLFVKSRAFFNAEFCVKAYAELEDGTYIYSDMVSFSVYEIADSLYTKRAMFNEASHDYLYNAILSYVNPTYTRIYYYE